MRVSSLYIRALIVGILSLAALVVWFPTLVAIGFHHDDLLSIHFLDVGQGDAIYIETPDGVQVLIDGGPDGAVLRELAQVMPVTDRSIDMVVGTHPDKDHIGGLIDVLERYQVDYILKTAHPGTTVVAERFAEAVVAEGAQVHIAETGQWYRLGAEVFLLVYSPTADAAQMQSNASSIVAQVQYGDTTFLLTGDAPIAIEEYLARTFGPRLLSDVLKLGHHGSRTSTSALLLDTVVPTYAVVSAGRDNSYGHPHDEVVTRVTERSIELLRTADRGRVTLLSDGQTVWVQDE